jgi:hypothetical protein
MGAQVVGRAFAKAVQQELHRNYFFHLKHCFLENLIRTTFFIIKEAKVTQKARNQTAETTQANLKTGMTIEVSVLNIIKKYYFFYFFEN